MNLNDSGFDALVKSFVLSMGSLGSFLVDKLYIFKPFDDMAGMMRDWHRKYTDNGQKEEDTYFGRMTKQMEEGPITVCVS